MSIDKDRYHRGSVNVTTNMELKDLKKIYLFEKI